MGVMERIKEIEAEMARTRKFFNGYCCTGCTVHSVVDRNCRVFRGSVGVSVLAVGSQLPTYTDLSSSLFLP
jgi:hypothetical protein